MKSKTGEVLVHVIGCITFLAIPILPGATALFRKYHFYFGAAITACFQMVNKKFLNHSVWLQPV